MDRVFVDTNILLDVLFVRDGYQASLELLQLGEEKKAELCTSVLSMANIAYILRKTFSTGERAGTLAQLSSMMRILPMDANQFSNALLLDAPDFEDALQVVCASASACDILVTHNTKDFVIGQGLSKNVHLPRIITPESYVQTIK